MKKFFLIALPITGAIGLALLIIALTTPIFAAGSDTPSQPSQQTQAWQDMYQACINGDWQAMSQAMQQLGAGHMGAMTSGGMMSGGMMNGTISNSGVTNDMLQACINGNWQAMSQAMQQYHGGPNGMPCLDGSATDQSNPSGNGTGYGDGMMNGNGTMMNGADINDMPCGGGPVQNPGSSSPGNTNGGMMGGGGMMGL